jgi:hypothetical protein
MSQQYTPGISPASGFTTRTVLVPAWGESQEIVKKSGNAGFTSYYLPSDSLMRPSVLRLAHSQDNGLYQGSTVNAMYRLPDTGKQSGTLLVIDNGTLTCSSDDCKSAVVPIRVAISVEVPSFDVMDEDELDGYIDLFVGTALQSLGTREIELHGSSYTVTNWLPLLRGSTEIR